MHALIRGALIQFALILGLSFASGYVIQFPDSNWDTTLFLTPFGIAHNFLMGTTLSAFYTEPSRGQTPLNLLMGLCYAAIAVHGLLLIRRNLW